MNKYFLRNEGTKKLRGERNGETGSVKRVRGLN